MSEHGVELTALQCRQQSAAAVRSKRDLHVRPLRLKCLTSGRTRSMVLGAAPTLSTKVRPPANRRARSSNPPAPSITGRACSKKFLPSEVSATRLPSLANSAKPSSFSRSLIARVGCGGRSPSQRKSLQKQRGNDQAHALAGARGREGQDVFRAFMAQVLAIVLAEEHAGRLRQAAHQGEPRRSIDRLNPQPI